MTLYRRALSGMLVILVLVGGCTVLPERSAKQTFLLPSPDFETSEERLPVTLRVLRPNTESPINGTSILVRPQDYSIQAYRGVRWGKSTPLLLRDYWLAAFRQVQSFQAVIHETSDAKSHVSLNSDLTAFQLEYQNGQQAQSAVVITVDAQITDSESGDVLAARRFTVREPAQAEPIGDLISSFSTANRTLAEELIVWAKTISRDVFQETDQARPL